MEKGISFYSPGGPGIPGPGAPEEEWTLARIEKEYALNGHIDFERVDDDFSRGIIPKEAYMEFIRSHITIDFLTDLSNRKQFMIDLQRIEVSLKKQFSALSQEQERKILPENVMIAMFDINNFKSINDQLGHAAGDEALRTFAGHLKKTLREDDKIYRLSGDEFTALFFPITAEDIIAIKTRIANALENIPFTYNGNEWVIKASVGFAVSNNEEIGKDKTMASILEEADANMYLDKNRQKPLQEV